jgi:hypothetical protein
MGVSQCGTKVGNYRHIHMSSYFTRRLCFGTGQWQDGWYYGELKSLLSSDYLDIYFCYCCALSQSWWHCSLRRRRSRFGVDYGYLSDGDRVRSGNVYLSSICRGVTAVLGASLIQRMAGDCFCVSPGGQDPIVLLITLPREA